MDSAEKAKVTEETQIERLSELPDSVLLHILSLIDTKTAVQTCVLSKRWISVWIYLPSLNFDCGSFKVRSSFNKFVLRFLSRRRACSFHSLRFCNGSEDNKHIIKDKSLISKVIAYANLHGVQEIETNNEDFIMNCSLPFQTLRTLKICHSRWQKAKFYYHRFSKYPMCAWLTTLHLQGVSFLIETWYHDLFSSFVNLEELSLINFWFLDAVDDVKISLPRLAKLTMLEVGYPFHWVDGGKKLIISSPRLSLLHYGGQGVENREFVNISVHGCPLLNRANIDFRHYRFSPEVQAKSVIRSCVYHLNQQQNVERNLCSKMKIFYERIIKNMIPETKSLVLQLGGCKIIFMKCKNSASIEVHGAELLEGKILLSWKLDRSENADQLIGDCLGDDLERVGLVDIFCRVGFVFCPVILLALGNCGTRLEHLFQWIVLGRFSDLNHNKSLESSLILAELPVIQAAFQLAWKNAIEYLDHTSSLHDMMPVTDSNSSLRRSWQCNVTRTLQNKILWQMQWPN